MDLGGILNAATNVGLAVNSDTSGSGSSLKEFLQATTTYGFQLKSNFEVYYSGFEGLTFYISEINIPGIKTNTGTIGYKGRSLTIPVNYEQGHEFSMIVVGDGTGLIYQKLREILAYDARQAKPASGKYIIVKTFGDHSNNSGKLAYLDNVRFDNIGDISYSHTANDLETFSVQGYTSEVLIKSTETTSSTGILGGLDSMTTTIGNIVGG